MNTSALRSVITFGATLALATGLAACSGEEETPEAPAAAGESADAADPAAGTGDESGEADAGGDQGEENTPDWAKPLTTPGEQIGTVEVGDLTVDVYQVGVAPASQDGRLLNPDTDEPLITEGDDLVFVNYVITNNGDPVELGMDLVKVTAVYDDWEWLQEMDSIEDDALMEQMDLVWTALDMSKLVNPPVFVLGSGESYSFGDNFTYQPDSQLTFTASYVPVDDQGEPLEDEKVEGTGTGTLD